MSQFHTFTVASIKGEQVPLSTYKGKLTLVVNVASECGLTPQYEGLQKLYTEFKDKGLVVLGFPCNQFGAQEPGTDAQVEDFACSTFKVTFPMFSKIEVNGDNTAPLYQFLKAQKPGKKGPDISWNFEKFLVDGNGNVVERFNPMVTPEEVAAALPKYL
jgi:glutathione peroxidase